MKVFTYAEDGEIKEQDLPVSLDPTVPGRASCVWRGMLIACDRDYLIEWALSVENKINLATRKRWFEDAIDGLRHVRKNIRNLERLRLTNRVE